MACCVCNRNRGLCKGCTCVKAGRTCFNCLPGRDCRCFNPLGSFSGPITPVKTVSSSSMAPSPLLQPLGLSRSSSSSLPDDSHSTCLREDMPYGESVSAACVCRVPVGTLPSWIVSPSCNKSTCGPNCSHNLANFCPMAEATFVWNDVDGVSFSTLVKSCYEVVVHWRRNVFKVLYGKSGASFVREEARLFQAHSDSSALESVTLYAALIMPPLLLQRPPGKHHTSELSRHLERCLSIWESGDLASLLQEGCAIQARLPVSCSSKNSDSLSREFSNLMLVGNVKDYFLIMNVEVFI